MAVTLESLELSPVELERGREAVRAKAFGMWQAAGCPNDRQVEFWVEAEREWIAREYVPHRPLDGTRAQVDSTADAALREQAPAARGKKRDHSSAGTSQL